MEQDYEKAVYWYKKAVENGDPKAMYNLALCYQDGLGVEQDTDKANELFEEAKKYGLDE